MISRTRDAQARPLSGRPSTVYAQPLAGLLELSDSTHKQASRSTPHRTANGSAQPAPASRRGGGDALREGGGTGAIMAASATRIHHHPSSRPPWAKAARPLTPSYLCIANAAPTRQREPPARRAGWCSTCRSSPSHSRARCATTPRRTSLPRSPPRTSGCPVTAEGGAAVAAQSVDMACGRRVEKNGEAGWEVESSGARCARTKASHMLADEKFGARRHCVRILHARGPPRAFQRVRRGGGAAGGPAVSAHPCLARKLRRVPRAEDAQRLDPVEEAPHVAWGEVSGCLLGKANPSGSAPACVVARHSRLNQPAGWPARTPRAGHWWHLGTH